MNRKILIYLCSFGTVIAAVCMYFISRENTEKAVITGEYDIWETDGSIVTETEANIITAPQPSALKFIPPKCLRKTCLKVWRKPIVLNFYI